MQTTIHTAVRRPFCWLLPLALVLSANPAFAWQAQGWGNNENGQLGIGNSNPTPTSAAVIGAAAGARHVVGGCHHSMFLMESGAVLTAGANWYGQLGNGTLTDSSAPVAVTGLGAGSGVIAISAGSDHCLALKSSGQVMAWGDNTYGQLGDNSTTHRNTPVTVSGLGAGSGVVAISSGIYHSVALKSDGTVWTWGANWSGQLGDGSNLNRTTPVAVSGISSTFRAIEAVGGAEHCMARMQDGSIVAWGDNGNGQLGDGTYTDRNTPVAVYGLGPNSGVIQVVRGCHHSMVLKSDGSVLAWGLNSSGQLGNGTTTISNRPVAVSGLVAGSGVVQLSLGAEHSLARKNDGSLLAWGSNAKGQLGDGSSGNRLLPQAIAPFGPLVAVAEVAAGGWHTLIVTSSGLSITGRVVNRYGAGVPGVQIQCDAPTTTVLTDSLGRFTFLSQSIGSHALTPSKVGSYFVPASRNVVLSASDVTGITFSAYQGATLTGRVATSTGVAIAGVAVSCTGASVTVLTNNAGYYYLYEVTPGSIVVTPAKASYRFSPASRSLTVALGATNGINFTAASGFNITGRIYTLSGLGVPNVPVLLSGSSVPAVTNSAGYYLFKDIPAGIYMLTPSSASLSFTPAARSVTVSGDLNNISFIAASGSRIIGRITTSAGVGLSGVTVRRLGSTATVITNSAGYFILTAVPNGTYTVTPEKVGLSFTPVTRTVTISGGDVPGINFVGSSG